MKIIIFSLFFISVFCYMLYHYKNKYGFLSWCFDCMVLNLLLYWRLSLTTLNLIYIAAAVFYILIFYFLILFDCGTLFRYLISPPPKIFKNVNIDSNHHLLSYWNLFFYFLSSSGSFSLQLLASLFGVKWVKHKKERKEIYVRMKINLNYNFKE